MKLTYIAGAYSGVNLSEVTRHVDEARKVAMMLAERRIPFLCTILQTAHFELLLADRDPGYDYWIDVSLEVLKRCDAVFVVPNWQQSNGPEKKSSTGTEPGMPVFNDIETLTNWVAQRY